MSDKIFTSIFHDEVLPGFTIESKQRGIVESLNWYRSTVLVDVRAARKSYQDLSEANVSERVRVVNVNFAEKTAELMGD